MKTTKWITGYKALNEDMTCKGFKFELGKEYTENETKLCEKGFHFCLNPFDVLRYYNLTNCKLATILSKSVSKETQKEDTKRVAKTIKIDTILTLADFIQLSFNYLWKECRKSKTKSGDSAQLASSGYSAKLASSGYSAQLASSGKDSIVAGIGVDNQAKGIIGNWLVLAEWKDNKPVCVKSVLIDGKDIKENVFYKLTNEQFEEVR